MQAERRSKTIRKLYAMKETTQQQTCARSSKTLKPLLICEKIPKEQSLLFSGVFEILLFTGIKKFFFILM